MAKWAIHSIQAVMSWKFVENRVTTIHESLQGFRSYLQMFNYKSITGIKKPSSRRGIALLEVMIAVGLLTIAVGSITQAIVSAQQQNLEARERIVASITAESLLSHIGEQPWEELDSWDGFREEPGTLTDPSGVPLSGDWEHVGRQVHVTPAEVFIDELQIYITGRTINVIVFTESGRKLSTLERFIAEPSS